MRLPTRIPTKRHPAYRQALRDIRQGGTSATPWRWYQHTSGACENWQLHERDDTEHVMRERYRATWSRGVIDLGGRLTTGAIFTTGSMCGPCAVAVELAYIHAVTTSSSRSSVRRALAGSIGFPS